MLGDAYTLEQELGGGGMSRVFVAYDVRLKRRVVVKVLMPELAGGISTGRFEREIALAASLQQANIVPVLHAGELNGLPFYTMPFVTGKSLRARLGEGALSIGEVISVLKDMTRALAYAHESGVVHRDIKPDNVLLSGGTAVVADFGIAKAISASISVGDSTRDATGALTQLGTALGTPAYMAPEQVAGDPQTDHRADLYAFGCVAYELLAGRPPFHSLTPQRLLAAHLSERPKPIHELRADVPAPLADLVMQCLEKDPDHRPQRATDIARALDSVTSGSASVLPASLLSRPRSLASALVIWAAVFGATYVLTKAAIVGIGLPDWVLPGALVVAGLGLPAVLFTHFVQRAARRAATVTPTLTPGGTRLPASTLATMAVQAATHVTWRRTWRAGAIAAGAFALLVAAMMVLRAMGIGPTASLFAKGVLDKNDRIIVSHLTMRGGDTTLGGTLTGALRDAIAQSRAITLLPPSAVREALARMERPTESVLTADLAREIAQRGLAKLVVGGEVTPLGGGYLITVQLLDPTKGDPLRSFRETARDAADVIPAIGRVAKDVRAGIGESMRSVQNTARLEQVTTSSLEAFRKYAQAIELSEGAKLDFQRARALLLEAVEIDTTFAMAYLKLAWLEPDPKKWVDFATKAHDNRGHLSELERHLADGMYYWLAANDLDRAIASMMEAYRIDSLHARTLTILSQVHMYGKRDSREALAWAERVDRVDSVLATDVLIPPLTALKRFPEAEKMVARQTAIRGATDVTVLWNRLLLLSTKGQYDSVATVLANATAASTSDPWFSGYAAFFKAQLDLMRGHLLETERRWPSVVAAGVALGMPITPVDLQIMLAFDDVWYRERPQGQGMARVDSVVARFKFDSLPRELRPYVGLAVLYSRAKRPADAKRWLARYDAEVKDTLQRRRDAQARHDALGWLSLAEGRAENAVSEFRQATVVPGPLCLQMEVGGLGLAFDVAGKADSVIATYERYLATLDGLCTFNADTFWRALILKRLGELYEQKDDRVKAKGYYQQFVELWKTADPDLQPRVVEVRKRLARLGHTAKR